MSHNNQKKIAVINDFTGFGKCSLTVSIPVISALKIQCCPIPTSILSNHTEYEDYFFDDYTDKMDKYIEQWKKLELKFEGIATGFLGHAKQIEIVNRFIREFKEENTIVLVDPVMGDNGMIYDTYTDELCEKMRQLVANADIVTPNLTEACRLVSRDYSSANGNEEVIKNISKEIIELGPEKVVITGLELEDDYVGNCICEKGFESVIIKNKKIGISRSGTGDLMSSIIIAEAVKGMDFYKSIEKAVAFVERCLILSEERNIPKEDGVCFEDFLTELN